MLPILCLLILLHHFVHGSTKCITEDELVCELSRCQDDVSEALTFANVVRRSASNFLLFEGSEFTADAAAGVMLVSVCPYLLILIMVFCILFCADNLYKHVIKGHGQGG